MRKGPDQNQRGERGVQSSRGGEEEFFTDAAGRGPRRRIIADLRALAAFLERHPELPVSAHTSVEMTYFPLTDDDATAFDEVAEVGARLGRIPAWEGEHYLVGRAVGAARYRAVAIPERVRARYRSWLTRTGHVHPD
ncbi:hypothetical protein [Nocardiopsis kunsanensis]|uniref:hypothetical protein n=1 Tax=Nocardiopsis kunsanensis TaxID=141693 RepID=UPI00034BB97A|nr:hypothetical protein [Nocardiopsis kunsanensis]